MKNLTTEQIENIVIDAGVVYVNYGETGERLLAPTMGGNTFAVEQEIKEIEVDGARAKLKGLRRMVREDVNLTVRLMDMSLENLKLALPGTKIEGGKLIHTGKVTDENYAKNITILGQTLKGEYKKITIFNPLSDQGVEISLEDKEESVIEMVMAAHLDPTDLDSPLYEVEDIASI